MYLHVVSTLPMGSPWHVILCSQQNKQVIVGLHCTCLVIGNFNTPCPALGLGTSIGVRIDGDIAVLSMRFTLDTGILLLKDENDDN